MNQLSFFSAGVNPRKVRLIEDHLSNGCCLDIGCGNGLYGLTLSKVCGNVLQLDIQDRRAEPSRDLSFQIMDVQKLALPDASYDFAIAFDIMEHLDDDALFARELFRVCRKTVILSVPAADDEVLKRFNLTHKHHTDKTHRREYSSEQLRQVMETAGFNVKLIKPQFNAAMNNVHKALETGSGISKIASRVLTVQINFLLWMGVYKNTIIGDWFCVAEKP